MGLIYVILDQEEAPGVSVRTGGMFHSGRVQEDTDGGGEPGENGAKPLHGIQSNEGDSNPQVWGDGGVGGESGVIGRGRPCSHPPPEARYRKVSRGRRPGKAPGSHR